MNWTRSLPMFLMRILKNKIHVINYTENSITIECDSSSVGSILKFERQKYLEIFKNYGLYNIEKLKIKIK